MGKYLLKRVIGGLLSVLAIVFIVMILVFSLTDKSTIVNKFDQTYSKLKNNEQEVYKYNKWETYGYIDFVTYSEFLVELQRTDQITPEDKADAQKISDYEGQASDYFVCGDDNPVAAEYLEKFYKYYESKGYSIHKLKAVKKNGDYQPGGKPQVYAYRDRPIFTRFFTYFGNVIHLDNVNRASGIEKADRKITFTLFDPAYQKPDSDKKVFAPAIMGNGTEHKYLLYVDNKFPFIHQNLITINLGKSTSINIDVDVWETMTKLQGEDIIHDVIYPTGVVEKSSDDIHTLQYVPGSFNPDNTIASRRFVDDYTLCNSVKGGLNRMGYSFIIGIISVILSYLIGVPTGIWMARKKDKIVDKIGTAYIIFIIAVPSLAYIYMFRALGGMVGLPTTFWTDVAHVEKYGNTIYILPIISLALPSIAGLMQWIRRYMIDQQNSDYVKFARSEGLSEQEIFSKHISKNALIPIVHGIPGSILGSLTGAIITESIYSVPGVGNILTDAINAQDNNVIVGVSLFYSLLSIVSIILGDILMSLVDPRIKFTDGGR